MDKVWYQSKTLWGFGLAGIIALAQVLGVTAADNTIAEVAKVLTALLGAYGLRDAL